MNTSTKQDANAIGYCNKFVVKKKNKKKKANSSTLIAHIYFIINLL